MINRLIDMNVQVETKDKPVSHSGRYTTEEYVYIFLDGLGETQKNRFKQMLEMGIQSGMSIAKSYGINYKDFIEEVKKQLNIK